MAGDRKLTASTQQSTFADNDQMLVVDVDDLTDSSTGTDKRSLMSDLRAYFSLVTGLFLNKQAAPANPPASQAELYYDQAAPGVGTTIKPVLIDESGNKIVVGGFGIKDYRLIRVVHIFQGTVTYTPSNGAQALYIECIGGGGAGGGAPTASANISLGSGGGAGALSTKWVIGTLKASYTVQVGAGGTGVSGSAGNPGTDSTFDTGPSICTGKGGAGGAVLAAGTLSATVQGGAGGAASSGIGDGLWDGCDGDWGLRLAAAVAQGGSGGDAPLGGSAKGGPVATAAGNAGGKYGGGGSGALTTGAAQVGGAGANGVIRVWEFA